MNHFNSKQPNLIPYIRTASRTDAGVHALHNAFTFDTSKHEERKEYSPEDLRMGLNYYLYKEGEQIMINQLYECKDPRFDCRGAPTQRTYIYKILLSNGKNRSKMSIHALQ